MRMKINMIKKKKEWEDKGKFKDGMLYSSILWSFIWINII